MLFFAGGALNPALVQGVCASGSDALDPDGARFPRGEPQGILRDSVKLQERRKDMFTILIIILVLVFVGALPTWPHSRSWGYYPSGGLGLILLILIILLLLGRI